MLHRWTKERGPGGAKLGGVWVQFQSAWPLRRQCVKCGMIVRRARWDYGAYNTRPMLYAPLASTWRQGKKLPKCEGLPADYQAPMGA